MAQNPEHFGAVPPQPPSLPEVPMTLIIAGCVKDAVVIVGDKRESTPAWFLDSAEKVWPLTEKVLVAFAGSGPYAQSVLGKRVGKPASNTTPDQAAAAVYAAVLAEAGAPPNYTYACSWIVAGLDSEPELIAVNHVKGAPPATPVTLWKPSVGIRVRPWYVAGGMEYGHSYLSLLWRDGMTAFDAVVLFTTIIEVVADTTPWVSHAVDVHVVGPTWTTADTAKAKKRVAAYKTKLKACLSG